MRCVAFAGLALVVGCRDDAGDFAASTGMAGPSGTATEAGAPPGAGDGPRDADGGSTTGGSGQTETDGGSDADADATTDATTRTDGAADDPDGGDDGPVAGAPVELYRGPVLGGIVPDWDAKAPRPLLMLGRLGPNWVATLARIAADGSLSQNATEEIIVWGWETDPPLLYDGTVGGALSGWDSSAPYPVVLVGRLRDDATWTTTLSSINATGTLGDNVADRLVVWGWETPLPGAPGPLYDGPVAGGVLPGWDGDTPEPLVLLGRLAGTDTWQTTLASITPDGALGDNVAEQIVVWGW